MQGSEHHGGLRSRMPTAARTHTPKGGVNIVLAHAAGGIGRGRPGEHVVGGGGAAGIVAPDVERDADAMKISHVLVRHAAHTVAAGALGGGRPGAQVVPGGPGRAGPASGREGGVACVLACVLARARGGAWSPSVLMPRGDSRAARADVGPTGFAAM